MTLPHGWTSRRFDQLGELCSGSTPSSSRTEFWDGATVWVTPSDLSRLNTPYLHDSAKHITERGLRNCSARLLPPGSIVLSSRAPIGYVAIPTVPFCTNQGCKSIALHNSYHSEFVYYAVTAAVPRLKRFGEGTTFAEISKSSLAKAEVVLPIDNAEQAKIAEVLSTVDRAIEQTEALIVKQQRIKTGLMQDLLTRGIDEHGNLRSKQTHEFKDSPLGQIPVEWELRSLGQCVRADAPICYGILMPGRGVDNGVPVIKVKDIVGGRIVQDNLLLTDRRIDRQYRRSRLRHGDVVITIRGTTGRLAMVPPELDGANITQDTARVRLSDDHSARFCFYCLQSESTQAQIALHTIGQAVKGINIGDVKRLLLAMPSLHEQERLADRFEDLEHTTYSTSRALAKLKSTRAGLMNDLLTGNRRVAALLGDPEQVVGA